MSIFNIINYFFNGYTWRFYRNHIPIRRICIDCNKEEYKSNIFPNSWENT